MVSIKLEIWDADTVFITSSEFHFTYIVSDSIVKDEFKGKYRYIGGLQCKFKSDSEEYKKLEKSFIKISEILLNGNIIEK